MNDLRLDYSVECEWCGKVEDVPARHGEASAREYLSGRGWKLVNDENRCAECVEKE